MNPAQYFLSVLVEETLKQEIKEALALELTKAIINERSKHERALDVTDAELWVHVYIVALGRIEKGYKEQMVSRGFDSESWENSNP